jgi:hypothetical protein
MLTTSMCSAGFKPFMEYAGSYALFNYRLEDPGRGLEYDNLRLIRAFEHGLDPSSSEAGFVLVHIAMVKESGKLVEGAAEMLKSCGTQDRERFNDGLRTLVGGLSKVNAVMNSKYINQTLSSTGLISVQQCGIVASRRATPTSALSSSASHRSPCSRMASSTKA